MSSNETPLDMIRRIIRNTPVFESFSGQHGEDEPDPGTVCRRCGEMYVDHLEDWCPGEAEWQERNGR